MATAGITAPPGDNAAVGGQPLAGAGGPTSYPPSQYPSSPYSPMPYAPSSASSAAGATGNRFAFITFAIVAVYLVIALETRVVIFGILPLGMSMRSRRGREPLAPLAIAAAVVSIVVAVVRLA